MAKQKGSDLDEVKTRSSSDKVKVTDLIDIYSFPSQKYVTLRLHGPMYSYCMYWVTTVNKEGKKTKFPVASPSYDPSIQDFDTTKYDPWKALADKERADGVEQKDRKIQISTYYYVNGILRAHQKNEPRKRPPLTATEKKSGFKEKGSDSWTPNVVVRLTGNNVDKIKKFSGMNTVTSKQSGTTKSYSVTHPKFGCDIRIQYDKDAKAAANAYDIQFVDKKTPLSEEEQAELKWDLTELQQDVDQAEVKRDFEGWAKRNGVETSSKKASSKKKGKEEDEDFDDDFGDDDEDDAPKSKKKKPAPAKTSKKSKSDEDDEDEDDFGDDEDDEDEAPKSKKKPAAKSSKKRRDEDDDEEEEEEDEDDESEDDEDSDDEDDDFGDDDDSDDDEDEDDAPRSKSKSKKPAPKASSKSKRSSRDEDEDEDGDDDESEEDDDDDFSPPVKKKAPAKGKSTSKSKRSSDDDEDEEEDEDDFGDDDDEDDDEPPAKSKKKAPVKSTKKAPAKKTSKRKPAEDDEDEDDFGDDDEDDL